MFRTQALVLVLSGLSVSLIPASPGAAKDAGVSCYAEAPSGQRNRALTPLGYRVDRAGRVTLSTTAPAVTLVLGPEQIEKLISMLRDAAGQWDALASIEGEESPRKIGSNIRAPQGLGHVFDLELTVGPSWVNDGNPYAMLGFAEKTEVFAFRFVEKAAITTLIGLLTDVPAQAAKLKTGE